MLAPPGRDTVQESAVGIKVAECLEEVVWRPSADHWLAGSWAGFELQAADNNQRAFQAIEIVRHSQSVLLMLVNFHYCGLITASVAVVWCTKDRDHISVLTPIISLHHQLMCSGYQRQAVVVVES